jgi:hypothetical protein
LSDGFVEQTPNEKKKRARKERGRERERATSGASFRFFAYVWGKEEKEEEKKRKKGGKGSRVSASGGERENENQGRAHNKTCAFFPIKKTPKNSQAACRVFWALWALDVKVCNLKKRKNESAEAEERRAK